MGGKALVTALVYDFLDVLHQLTELQLQKPEGRVNVLKTLMGCATVHVPC